MNELTKIRDSLSERLEEHDNNRRDIQDQLKTICNDFRAQINDLEERINCRLEEAFQKEDDRLQHALMNIQNTMNPEETDKESAAKVIQSARAELLVRQTFSLKKQEPTETDNFNISALYDLEIKKDIVTEWLELTKPKKLEFGKICSGKVFLNFNFLSDREEAIISENNLESAIESQVSLTERGGSSREYKLDRVSKDSNEYSFLTLPLNTNASYDTKVRVSCCDKESEWSEPVTFSTKGFVEYFAWNDCPDNVYDCDKYIVNTENPRIATQTDIGCCTIIGNAFLTSNTVTTWSIKILSSERNDANGIYVGVAPFDIDQSEDGNCDTCGWYFYCYFSTLYSGFPHGYRGRVFGERKKIGQYVHTGDSVGIVMDTIDGNISFSINGKSLGVGFEGIPLDKPLVPCVILRNKGDSIEFVI